MANCCPVIDYRSRSWCMCTWCAMLRSSRIWLFYQSAPSRRGSRWVIPCLTHWQQGSRYWAGACEECLLNVYQNQIIITGLILIVTDNWVEVFSAIVVNIHEGFFIPKLVHMLCVVSFARPQLADPSFFNSPVQYQCPHDCPHHDHVTYSIKDHLYMFHLKSVNERLICNDEKSVEPFSTSMLNVMLVTLYHNSYSDLTGPQPVDPSLRSESLVQYPCPHDCSYHDASHQGECQWHVSLRTQDSCSCHPKAVQVSYRA